MSTQVFVVDDDAVARAYAAGVASSLGLDVQRFESAESFLLGLTPETRGCVILDLQMGGMTGLELQAEMQRRGIDLPVIIVSGQAEVASAVTAMKLNAFDFFEKPVQPQLLQAAVRRAVEQDAARHAKRIETAEAEERYNTLSPRERQVMGLVVAGLPNKQMATRLTLSEKTIEVHRGNVMRKMRVDSVAALVRASILVQIDGVDHAAEKPDERPTD